MFDAEILMAVLVLVVLWLMVTTRRLSARIAALEARQRVPDKVVKDTATDTAPDTAAITPGNAVDAPPFPWPDKPAETAGPWAKKTPEEPPEPSPDRPPRSFVFRKDRFVQLGRWIAANWVLVIAAVSLVLAGVFLVQYGVENGLLTPFWRIMGAFGLGVALIVGGEFIRRRAGDDAESHAAFLPSTFAGAGIVTLFAGCIAARQLYGLIGVETTFVGLVMIACLAVALGWFYGQFLASIGILGATAAPFVLGGIGAVPVFFFYFYALISLTGLLIDALRRWAWVSVVAVVFPHVGAWLLFAAGGAPVHYVGFGVIVAGLGIVVPPLASTPRHGGAMISDMVRLQGKSRWPDFPTRIAAGGVAGGVGASFLAMFAGPGLTESWLILGGLTLMFLGLTIWTRHAPALADLAALPVVALLAVLADQAVQEGAIYAAFMTLREPESGAPRGVAALIALAAAWSAIAFWRSLNSADRGHALAWAGLAALTAPAVIVVIETLWQPVPQITAYGWALHGLAIAALMTGFASAVAKQDEGLRTRAALFALSAAVMIAFALIVTLSDVALTLALALAVLGGAMVDRAFGLRALAVFVQVGTLVVGWRLVLDPGVFWAQSGPLFQVVAGYGGAIALLGAAWLVLRGLHRPGAAVTLESAIWTLGAVFLSVLIFRALGGEVDSHWGMGLTATVWLSAMACQVYRQKLGGWLRWVRVALATVFAVPGFGALALVGTIFNPILSQSETVQGPFIADSLMLALLLPALPLWVIAWRFDHVNRWVRGGFGLAGTALAATYVGFEIRRAWRGDVLAVPGTTGPELYTYTVALLVTGIALLFLAFARRSVSVRRLAMGMIALTIAKVFLVDMSGLAGLVRVASFLGLGLSLAGLAWINRRMTDQWDRGEPAKAP